MKFLTLILLIMFIYLGYEHIRLVNKYNDYVKETEAIRPQSERYVKIMKDSSWYYIQDSFVSYVVRSEKECK